LRQASILEHAARLVRPGGRLAYSTCTFNPEENEGALARFLAGHPEFELVTLPQRPGFAPGVCRDVACNVSTHVVRLWPHLAPGEGHFIAVLRKNDETLTLSPPRPWRQVRLTRQVEQGYRDFCGEHLAGNPVPGRLALVGSYLYALPDDLPDLSGLRYLHPGWWLGVIKKARFEPAHALALGLAVQDAARMVDLAPAAVELAAYLRGETLPSPGEDGWALVAVDGYALGWGKRVGGRLKSHYPRGLRPARAAAGYTPSLRLSTTGRSSAT
jgi:NOL1/NOP2/fmu family ribosome biogenesis protein